MRSTLLAAIVVCLLAGTGGGCALLKDQATTVTAEKSPLKKLTPTADAILLDVYFVERPIRDPLLGAQLWSHLDQVSTLQASTISSLERNGFRFGIAPTDPPRALQAALGMTGEMIPRDDSVEYRMNGHRYTQRSGEEFSIDAWSGYEQCEIFVDQAGTTRTSDYANARCVFRVKVERTQDGWARLEFVPEVHHGQMKLRSVADEHSWTTTSSQLIDPQFDQRFVVELNLGEMVVLGASGDESASLGHHFFRGGDTGSKLQRLLVVRLADMKRIEPLYR